MVHCNKSVAMRNLLTVLCRPLAPLRGLSCVVRVSDMSSDLIRFLADSADELVVRSQEVSTVDRADMLAEASEMLSLAARLTRRAGCDVLAFPEAA